MKLSTKIILPIILISALLILLAGCFGIPDSSPGYTPGSITGRIMVPLDCSDCLTDGDCLPSKSISDLIPSHWVPAEEAIVTVIPHATLTDEDGYYTLANVEPGVYYVITATYKNLVLKDVVEPDGVEAGKTYDAGTANCESTALALVVEYFWDMGLDAEEIEVELEDYIMTDKFAELVDTVCCIIEDCDNITNYCCLVECDEPGFTPELESLTVITDPISLCVNGTKNIEPYVTFIAHYAAEEPDKIVFADCTYSSNNSDIALLSGTNVTGKSIGSTDITVSASYTEGDITVTATGTIPVTVIDCEPCIDNIAPTLTVPTSTTLNPGDSYSITVTAEDADNILGTLTFRLVSISPVPVNALSVAADGTITWNPTCDDIVVDEVDTVYTVTVGVSDGCDETTGSFNITLNAEPCEPCFENIAPVFDSVWLDNAQVSINEIVDVVVGNPYVVTVNAHDPDNKLGTLTYSATINGFPVGTVASNVITVTPYAVGTFEVYVNVNDGCTTTPWGPVIVVVHDECYINQIPSLTMPDDDTVNPGGSYSWSVTASDPDDIKDPLSFTLVSVVPAPFNNFTVLTVDATTGEISWNPTCDDIIDGDTTYTVTVEVTDGCDPVQGSFKVTLYSEPCEPCISANLLSFEFKVKLPSDGSSWENWTEYLASKFSPTDYGYTITTYHNGGPKYGFRVTAECEDNTKIWFNWYRGEQCGDSWLSTDWILIDSGGIYPAGNYENSLCNQGGNILQIKVKNTITDVDVTYIVDINRTKQ